MTTAILTVEELNEIEMRSQLAEGADQPTLMRYAEHAPRDVQRLLGHIAAKRLGMDDLQAGMVALIAERMLIAGKEKGEGVHALLKDPGSMTTLSVSVHVVAGDKVFVDARLEFAR